MINLLKGSKMLLHKFKINIFFLFILILILFSCSGEETKITKIYDNVIPELYDDIIIEKSEINCPKVRFIQGMDKIKFVNKPNNIYEINFYEVKWKCYSYSIIDNEGFNKNIDLDIKFKIDYEDNVKIFKEEKFTFVIALINNNNEVIVKNKFDQLFFNKENSEILNNQNSIINIELKNNSEEIDEYTLLLGFIK
jgi:hypothetical protein